MAMPDARLGERACAFVVGADVAPTSPAVREYLDELGVARQYWPERVELIEVLPRNAERQDPEVRPARARRGSRAEAVRPQKEPVR